jgi:hypothetical protein
MRQIVIFSILLFTSSIAFCQDQVEGTLFIVDSIPIFEDPKEGSETLNENEIDRIEVITDKQEIENTSYGKYDKLIFVFTKEYKNRPDSIRRIPSTVLLKNKSGSFLKSTIVYPIQVHLLIII